MRFFVVAAILGLAAPAFAHSKQHNLTYNTHYDDKHGSLKSLTCWIGEHGLLSRGLKVFGDLPTYPHVGGIPQITTHDKRYCGSCWEITYKDSHGHTKQANYTAIDAGPHHPDGFSTSLESFDYLTDDQGKKLKTVLISAVRKPKKVCGL